MTDIQITFGPATSKARKTWKFSLTESIHLEGCSEQLQHMIVASQQLASGFTLEELARRAHENGMVCKVKKNDSPDFHAIGYTHRPKLLELGIITAE